MANNNGNHRESMHDSKIVTSLMREYIENFEDLDTGEVVPTLAGMARHIGITQRTLNKWSADKVSDEICDLMDRLKDFQEVELVNKSLIGVYKPQIAGMMLSAHGYSNKVDNVSSDGSMTPAKSFNDMYED